MVKGGLTKVGGDYELPVGSRVTESLTAESPLAKSTLTQSPLTRPSPRRGEGHMVGGD
jgi:hypothetical protein